MKIHQAHLSYCTNIHPGLDWATHFQALKTHIPEIKKQIAPGRPMGIGLRVSHAACKELLQPEQLEAFKTWMQEEDAYVFTINGFPYGDFHAAPVKDQVHAPDWLDPRRVEYTVELFKLLISLLPSGLDGGISTSPLSYKPWFSGEQEMERARKAATGSILSVLDFLHRHYQNSGQVLHLDLEPEPDGLIESGAEFIHWYDRDVLPLGKMYFQRQGVSGPDAEIIIKRHLRLCYDVCHFALGYEDHRRMLDALQDRQIQVGKLQVSAALKAGMQDRAKEKQQAFSAFDEPIYLHQVIARASDGSLLRYRDIPEALQHWNETETEWRAHFHVPIFISDYGLLESTQQDILEVLDRFKQKPFTRHIEVETYTWGVLPEDLKKPIEDSIIRELKWVCTNLKSE